MKESERLRAENDKLQKKLENQLDDINSTIQDMIKKMRGE